MVRPIIYDDNFMRMTEIIDSLIPMMNDIVTNLLKTRGGNALAGQRARKAMIIFEKQAKEFRKVSVRRKRKTKEQE